MNAPWWPPEITPTLEGLRAAEQTAYDNLPPDLRQFIRTLHTITPDMALFARWALTMGAMRIDICRALLQASHDAHAAMVKQSWEVRRVVETKSRAGRAPIARKARTPIG